MSVLDYSAVTEKAGDRVTQEALSMLYARYRFASEFSRGKRLLEVACGEGIGLRYLAQQAGHAIGGDVTAELIDSARRLSPRTLPLLRLSADALPLGTATRDVVVCYEAMYYIERFPSFLQECRRVLTPQGVLLLCTVNPEWLDFNPSPHSRRYYSAHQLSVLLQEAGFQSESFGAFSTAKASARALCLSWLKRVAVKWHLIPSTMDGKQLLKRLFLGHLVPFPSTVQEGMAAYTAPQPVPSDRPVDGYKVLFMVARPA
ncbi:MAG: class I SAM-dependent methyltransferase [Nitrospirota bacterium]